MTTQLRMAAAALAASLMTAGLMAAAPALAADASASVQITSLQFSAGSGLTVQWLPDSLYQSLFAESREAGGLGGNDLADPAPGAAWADQQLATGMPHATAAAQATTAGLLAVAGSASRSILAPDPDAGQPHRGLAWAQQSGWFQLSGAGSLSISVGYQIAAAAPLGDGNGSFAGATLQLQAGNLDAGSSGLAEDQLWSFDLPAGSASRSGTLSLVVDISDPLQTGFYDLRANADVSAVSSVPEPGGWTMLALGLAALGALVRRQSRAG